MFVTNKLYQFVICRLPAMANVAFFFVPGRRCASLPLQILLILSKENCILKCLIDWFSLVSVVCSKMALWPGCAGLFPLPAIVWNGIEFMSKKIAPASGPASFEEAMAELAQLVTRMEAGALPLEASVAAYARGSELVRYCAAQLEQVEAQVKVLEGDMLKPFSTSAEGIDEALQ